MHWPKAVFAIGSPSAGAIQAHRLQMLPQGGQQDGVSRNELCWEIAGEDREAESWQPAENTHGGHRGVLLNRLVADFEIRRGLFMS